jgi:hypothetical protein
MGNKGKLIMTQRKNDKANLKEERQREEGKNKEELGRKERMETATKKGAKKTLL